MSSAGNVMIRREAERSDVLLYRIPGFIGGHVESRYPGSPKALHETHRLHALLLIEVTQCTQDQPGLHAGPVDCSCRSVINNLYNLFRLEAVLGMQQWCKSDLRIDHMIFAQLFKQILSNKAQLPFGLHELESNVGSRKEIGQIGAFRWGNEGLAVSVKTHFRRQT